MKRTITMLLLLISLAAYSQESDTNKLEPQNSKSFLVKGNLGWGVFPGLTGYLLYMEVQDSLSYTSGITLSGDFMYLINRNMSVGLNTAFLPIYHFSISGMSASIDLIPVIAQFQYNFGSSFYMNIGLGMGLLHGAGKTELDNVYFYDLVSGQSTGKSFDVWRGPYFMLSYAFGWQIDLSGKDQFGLDLSFRDYMIFGNPGLDTLGELAEKYAHVPSFLAKLMFNVGLGVYYKF